MTYDSRFEAELMKLVKERITQLLECLVNRNAVPDFVSYHFLVGQIDALRHILPELCEEANRVISGAPVDGA